MQPKKKYSILFGYIYIYNYIMTRSVCYGVPDLCHHIALKVIGF